MLTDLLQVMQLVGGRARTQPQGPSARCAVSTPFSAALFLTRSSEPRGLGSFYELLGFLEEAPF